MKIFITTGDPDGIGLEVTLKSLRTLFPNDKHEFYIFSSVRHKIPKSIGKFTSKSFSSLELAFKNPFQKNQLKFIQNSKSPSQWVKTAAKYLHKNPKAGCLVNAPMSKLKNGNGHTEILKQSCRVKKVFMCFYGRKFNIVLGTTHIPIDQVSNQITKQHAKDCYKAAQLLHRLTKATGQVRALGLNPHSGEKGSISHLDHKISKWIFNEPLIVPDAAFVSIPKNDTLICWYHDQGLIPFKMVHGFSNGIQVTLGLPFIRTSVDHGTAKDIFGKNIAKFDSMKLAIKMAIQWTKNIEEGQFNENGSSNI